MTTRARRGRTPRFLRPGWILLAALLAVGTWWSAPRVMAGWRAARTGDPAGASLATVGEAVELPPPSDTLARAPEGVRVKVHVVNTTRVRGLARRATQYLRDRGWDVVEVGTTTPVRERTLVVDRSGHPEWARRVAHAMGGAAVESRPDSSRYLDVTVLVGSTWRPPSEPFHP
jgi:hypothetical protein